MHLIDGLDGEMWDIELASDQKLAEMDAAYVRYTDDTWGKHRGDLMRQYHAEIRAEIALRQTH